MNIRIPEYVVWLQQLQSGDQCSLAFVDCLNLERFRLKQAEVVGETDKHLKVGFLGDEDTIFAWVSRELGSGVFISTPIFLVQPVAAEVIDVTELQYPENLREITIHAFREGWKGLLK